MSRKLNRITHKQKKKTKRNFRKTKNKKLLKGGGGVFSKPLPQNFPNNVSSNNNLEVKDNRIIKEDILYQDNLVCILRPEVKKGIIIFTIFNQPKEQDSLCKLGLKTGLQMHREGILYDRRIYHPYIFFRAPFYNPDIINYTSIENEIKSSYGEFGLTGKKAYIRVDPDKTFVFSSEIRVKFFGDSRLESLLNASKKTMKRYLEIIKSNSEKKIKYPYKWDLITSEQMPGKPSSKFEDDNPLERNSEVLVSIPHLTPNYFVKCID